MPDQEPVIRILRPGDESALEAFLLPRLDTSMFLVSNLRTGGIIDTGQRLTGTYAATFEGECITGVVAHFWNQNLIMQAAEHLPALSAAALAASRRPLRGIIGPADQVRVVWETFGVAADNCQIDETEYLYSLGLDALAEPEDLRQGQVRGRRIEPRDLDQVTAWRVAYSLETLGDHEDTELWRRCRASMEASLREGNTWVLEDRAGTPLAQTSFNAATTEAVQVGGVWTPPELRGRGYARAVVAASLRDARIDGARRGILFTGVTNIAAQKAYTSLGFQHIGDYRIVLLREAITNVTA